MRRIYHKFLIVFVIMILLGGVYFYFSNSLKSEAALSSSLGPSEVTGGSSDNEKIYTDISFIATLGSLKKINIDTTLFENRSFQLLKDNTVKLEPAFPGRVNPFAPMESVSGFSNSGSPVKTNEPLEIKSQSAVFSGSVSNPNIASGGYFEYGTTEDLGQKTSQVNLSLIGTFIFNLTDLNSKTTYFYKACAQTGASNLCGSIVSFETN